MLKCLLYEGAGLNRLKIYRTLDYISSYETVSSSAVSVHESLPLSVD